MSAIASQVPHDCLLNSLFRRRSKKILKLRATGLCEGNSPMTAEPPPPPPPPHTHTHTHTHTQRASEAENVSIWWRHHDSVSSKHICCHCLVFVVCNKELKTMDKIMVILMHGSEHTHRSANRFATSRSGYTDIGYETHPGDFLLFPVICRRLEPCRCMRRWPRCHVSAWCSSTVDTYN